ncbi:hypothetical protein K503DRAFT_767916 [Rhizopogon vinicolor AM-OR11-026]|uniref:Uncharacterized protein n=1 Tax=Rhizopogon vinicolor AM-OR11-026 TaxID=1314800 RepID=A0A1B7N8M2_9AGAM|nr:hypothetical protein K503DRAFT_767916 [Rhizopogon vinicolor AM-OR11-026]
MSISTYDYEGGLHIPDLHKNTSLNTFSVILLAPPADDYIDSPSLKPLTSYTKKRSSS